MKQAEEKKIRKIAEAFGLSGVCREIIPCGGGHINRTYRVTQEIAGEKRGEIRRRSFILQQINTDIFRDPEALMSNLEKVTASLRSQILARGGDPERETLHFLPDKRGKLLCQDLDGAYWRAMLCIEGTTCYEQVEKAEHFYESGRAFGRFQQQLAGFPAEELTEIIPDFHHTPKRNEKFLQVLERDACGRAAEVQPEIIFLQERAKRMGQIQDLKDQGQLPLRVTHNDTKLANVMIDDETGEAICVIDLDTVMPGLSVFDYGDSLRYGACTAAEDETDLSRVSLDLELMEAYTRGFLEECGDSLTERELAMLPEGAWTITMEQGMRFLTDYLEGDVYYQIKREKHNLDRARTQFALAADMERKWEEMKKIVERYQ